jgi:glycosyltransferase involved in cell wall biosynthesis
MKPRILIGIPCYNCQNQITRVISKLEQKAQELVFDQIVFVDNGSNDATLETIKKKQNSQGPLKNKIKVMQNQRNYGLGGTHKVIFNIAINEGYDWVIILHGDDQASIEDISPISSFALSHSCTTLGARFLTESKLINYQFSRILGNRILNLIFSLVTLRPVYDLGSGLNIFKVEDLRELSLSTLTDFFNFNCELLLEFFSYRKKMLFYPITWSESDQVSNARNVKVALSMLKSLFNWKFNLNKPAPIHSDLKLYQSNEI